MESVKGASLHDFFAAHAMPLVGVILLKVEEEKDNGPLADNIPQEIARLTFEIANAMVEEGKKYRA